MALLSVRYCLHNGNLQFLYVAQPYADIFILAPANSKINRLFHFGEFLSKLFPGKKKIKALIVYF